MSQPGSCRSSSQRCSRIPACTRARTRSRRSSRAASPAYAGRRGRARGRDGRCGRVAREARTGTPARVAQRRDERDVAGGLLVRRVCALGIAAETTNAASLAARGVRDDSRVSYFFAGAAGAGAAGVVAGAGAVVAGAVVAGAVVAGAAGAVAAAGATDGISLNSTRWFFVCV